MMHTASEKLAIIRLVEDSELSVRRTLDEIKVSRTSFYRWYAAYEKGGLDGLSNQGRVSRRLWNRIPDAVRSLVVAVALDRPELTPRELAWHITDTHDDDNVDIRHGKKMNKALKKAGKKVTFVKLRRGGHSLTRDDALKSAILEAEAFISQHIR